MKFDALCGLKLLMGMVCAFHVVMGAGLIFSAGFAETAAGWYGAEVQQWSPQFLYILHPLGVFMLALGVLAGAAAVQPRQHRITIYVFAGIFVARALQRLLHGSEISEIFGIGSGRNLTNMAFFFLLAAVLVVADQIAHRVLSNRPTAAT